MNWGVFVSVVAGIVSFISTGVGILVGTDKFVGIVLIALGCMGLVACLFWWIRSRGATGAAFDARLWDALRYIQAGSRWGATREWERYGLGGDDYLSKRSTTGWLTITNDGFLAEEFRQKAVADKIAVSGREPSESAYAILPASFWETSSVDIKAFARWRDDGIDTTDGGASEPRKGKAQVYVGLRVNRRALEKTWPRLGRLDQLARENMGTGHG